MRFYPKKKPEYGTLREANKFAWLPTRINDGFRIWFEPYTAIYEYTPWCDGDDEWYDGWDCIIKFQERPSLLPFTHFASPTDHQRPPSTSSEGAGRVKDAAT